MNRLGRPKGSPNKVTKAVKETFLDVFNAIQALPEHDPYSKAKLINWAKENPEKFYPLATKLIPTEIDASVEHAHYVMRSPEISPSVEQWQQQHPEVTIQ